jgi:uncharacterized protein
MPVASVVLVMLACAVFGALGALLGIGGGVFLVPFLVLAIHVPIQNAIGISLVTVIATSAAVVAGAGQRLTNVRLGLMLLVATLAGSLLAGISTPRLPPSMLHLLFALVTFAIAVVMLSRLDVRNVILDTSVDPGVLGGRLRDEETGRDVVYRVRRLPFAIAGSFVAGTLSTLLGIGGGILTVPMLNSWCGVPMRAAAATSVFMLGATATSGAVLAYGRGDVILVLAAAAVLGVRVGSQAGLRFGARAPVRSLKLLMAGVLMIVSVLMLTQVR